MIPADAVVRYTVPMPDDSRIPGRDADEMALNGSVLSTVNLGGAEGTRTPDFLNAIEALSQLSYSPTRVTNIPEAHHRRNRGPLEAPHPTRVAAI